ncbi:MAG TPA: pyridoxal-phosphate dependent enzyme [Mycobacteriales bacterium]|nr:pyridoxal-phosphate dependent enzyme [Mycobacteriales bacterium]
MREVTLGHVEAAAAVLAGIAHRTPVLTSRTLDTLTGARVALKAEHLQRVGAFKFRGAYHALARLTPTQRSRGVVAFSSGNHAQAVALAARLFEVPATIVMPHDAPSSKRKATQGYGAQIVGYDRYVEDRAAVAAQVAAATGAVLIPPFDHPDVIAGQGTAALELIADAGPLDVLLVPLGGGGLLAGCATVAAALCPGVRIYGVEPATGDDWVRSLAAGRPVSIPPPRTVADCLATGAPGALTFAVLRPLLTGVLTVSEEELVDAMRWAIERLHQVIEPGGAAGLAALLAGAVPDVAGARVGVILSGGNIGAGRLAQLLGQRDEDRP